MVRPVDRQPDGEEGKLCYGDGEASAKDVPAFAGFELPDLIRSKINVIIYFK